MEKQKCNLKDIKNKKLFKNISKFLKFNIYDTQLYMKDNSVILEYKNKDSILELEFKDDIIEINKEIIIFSEFFKALNLIKIFFNGNPENMVLFTGAFNPPTIAHYHMVHTVLRNKNVKFDYVVFALSNDNFLSKKQKKSNDWYFSEQERLNLILNMIAHNPKALLFGIEQGYTYQVLCEVKKQFNPKNLYFACGSDKLNEITRWGYKDKLLKEFCFYILLRGTDNENTINNLCNKIFINTKYLLSKDNEKYKNISATQVRNKIKNNENYDDLLERHVLKYLKTFLKEK